ncbi:alpha/beta hydrolase [Streptomyces sp. NPDC008238]
MTPTTARPGDRAAAEVAAATRVDARTWDLTVASAALGRPAAARIVLPADFARAPGRTWPVLYLLHGPHEDHTAWSRQTDVEELTADAGLILAMPDCGPAGLSSRWLDGSDYETFQLRELDGLLRRDYRASGVRAVAGVSTGGHGAMAHAARHPGTFRAAASFSGVLDTTFAGVPAALDALLLREDLCPGTLWGDPVDRWETWRSFNPAARAGGLRGTALYVSCGSGAAPAAGGTELLPEVLESTLWPAAHVFATALELRGITATTHYYEGGRHEWAYWRREFAAAWPLLSRALGLPEPSPVRADETTRR